VPEDECVRASEHVDCGRLVDERAGCGLVLVDWS
jgi:hypothetical protein